MHSNHCLYTLETFTDYTVQSHYNKNLKLHLLFPTNYLIVIYFPKHVQGYFETLISLLHDSIFFGTLYI